MVIECEECAALKELGNGKVPGADEITMQAFKVVGELTIKM